MPEDDVCDVLISIVVPVYNAAPFLKRTLNSIKRQTFKSWELLLVDDASTDGGAELIRKWKAEQKAVPNRILLLRNQSNRGPAYSRNRGLRAAKGRYLCYLDADDYWEAEKLEKQYRFMKERGCAFSFTGYEFANAAGKRNGKVVHVPPALTYRKALTNTTISTITVMFDRRQLPDELLLMPEDCGREDTATWWKILRSGYTAYGLDEALSVYCRHRGSHSANKLRAAAGTWRMYRRQEGLPLWKTMYCMTGYLARAVRRRLAQEHKGARNGGG